MRTSADTHVSWGRRCGYPRARTRGPDTRQRTGPGTSSCCWRCPRRGSTDTGPSARPTGCAWSWPEPQSSACCPPSTWPHRSSSPLSKRSRSSNLHNHHPHLCSRSPGYPGRPGILSETFQVCNIYFTKLSVNLTWSTLSSLWQESIREGGWVHCLSAPPLPYAMEWGPWYMMVTGHHTLCTGVHSPAAGTGPVCSTPWSWSTWPRPRVSPRRGSSDLWAVRTAETVTRSHLSYFRFYFTL